MRFTHGSSQNIENGNFELFDYIIDSNNKSNRKEIDNGNDAQGVGLYAYIGDNEESKKDASKFTKEDSGYLYILEVDVEKDELLNNRQPDEIEPEVLADAIEVFMKKIRSENGYDNEKFKDILFELEDDFNATTAIEINEKFERSGLAIRLNEYTDPIDFDGFDEWYDAVTDQYDLDDPCAYIMSEGGSLSVANYAINKAENLWDTIKYIGDMVSVELSGKGTVKLNKTFQDIFSRELKEFDIKVAFVNDESFAVIFDLDSINLVEKIDLNEKVELKQKSKKRMSI